MVGKNLQYSTSDSSSPVEVGALPDVTGDTCMLCRTEGGRFALAQYLPVEYGCDPIPIRPFSHGSQHLLPVETFGLSWTSRIDIVHR